jgi:hypothetical protein
MSGESLKAIILTYDRHRVMTQHMIAQYGQLWPDHRFMFRIPYQTLGGANSTREEYVETPPDIRGTVLKLIADLYDEEWIYWCVDDKYPIALRVEKISHCFELARQQDDLAGLLCCRCRITLDEPEVSLIPGSERTMQDGAILLERRKWYQIWIHQFLRVKVLRYFFSHMPKEISNAKMMDELKNDIPKPDNLHLFVTEENYAVFGESTQRGVITENCHRSIRASGLKLPEWFSRSNGNYVTMGELSDGKTSRGRKLLAGK